MRKYSIVLVALLCVCALFLQGCSLLSEMGIDIVPELSANAVYNKCTPSVVEITAKNAVSKKTGTGFFCDDKGTVVTNYHVIEGCTDIQISLYNGQLYYVDSVLGYDAVRDIAILDTRCEVSEPLTFGTEDAYTGQTVYAFGSSLGLTGTFSNGIVSCAKRNLNNKLYIQTTAPISPGNSGGPLLDAKGNVIGINTSCMIDGQNLNFAVPIGDVSKISTDTPADLEDLFTRSSKDIGRVKMLRCWTFTWSEEKECYALSFELCDQNGNNLTAAGAVAIEIVNDEGDIVYARTLNFSASDYTTVQLSLEERKLMTVYISESDIATGSTYDGTVSFKVYGLGYSFDVATARASDLPVSR